MIKKVWRFLNKRIKLNILIAVVNVCLLALLIYVNLNIVMFLDDIEKRVSIQEVIMEDQVKKLFELVMTLTNLTVRSDLDQLTLIEKLANTITTMQKTQSKILNYLNNLKTLDMEDIEKVKQANLVIYNTTAGYGGAGTHIRINNKDYILSCAHLIEEDDDAFMAIENKTNENIVLKLVHYDRSSDLSLFRMEKVAKHIPTLEISSEFPKAGSEVTVIGNPGLMPDVITDGIIANIGNKIYVMTNKVYCGNSGGCVLYKGKIIGVLSAVQIYFNFPQIQNYAIATNLKTLNRFMEDCQEKI